MCTARQLKSKSFCYSNFHQLNPRPTCQGVYGKDLRGNMTILNQCATLIYHML